MSELYYLAQNPGSNPTAVPNPANADLAICGSASNPGISTALGCFPFNNPNGLSIAAIRVGTGISAGIAIFMIAAAAFTIMTSQGDPKRLENGQSLLTAAISGLILIIGAGFFMRLLGIDVLGLF